ncbi:hypothetical protein LCGC14_3144760 [marine sediment metagenome]|uniref:Uncharacterized protein n=1 Tax=marine sediment metagenome TaxID=412755 RepID=A0A0F8VVY5_9ZZZZ
MKDSVKSTLKSTLTIHETAQELNKSIRSVWYYIKKGWLPKPIKQSMVITHTMLVDTIPGEAVAKLKLHLEGRE